MIFNNNPLSLEAQPACANYVQQSQSTPGSKKTPFVFKLRRQTIELNAGCNQSSAQPGLNPFLLNYQSSEEAVNQVNSDFSKDRTWQA